MKEKLKMISISWENYDALKGLGRAGDSFNDVLSKLLEEPKVQKQIEIRKKERGNIFS
jgi:predicted CopG family antitoxin